MSTIPASAIVAVNPGVINSGGSPLSLNGVVLTSNPLMPTGTVQTFASLAAVGAFFGLSSTEYAAAQVYFAGNDNSSIKPSEIIFAPYVPTGGVAAFLQSGNLAGLTLTQLQALSGRLLITIDGVPLESSVINLSSASSFSNAATLMQAGFTGGSAPVVTWNAVNSTFLFTSPVLGASSTITYAQGTEGTATACTSSSTNLTIGGTVTGTFNVGDIVEGTDGTNSLPANCRIVSQTSGTAGGAGVYVISAAATPSNLASCAVTSFDANGAIAIGLELTQATGAVLSQGAIADTPTTAMNNVVTNTQDWVLFTTIFEPTLSNKELFAVWTNGQNQRYGYVAWDGDTSPTTSANATGSFGNICEALAYNTVCPVWNTLALAMFVLGTAACINFEATQGRISFAFKTQSGFVPTVTNQQVGANLEANGYSFYGAYATANEQFNFFYNGNVSGKWNWLDTFVNQVYLNSQLQLALMELLTQVNSIPYNPAGYSLIRAAMTDPITQFINFGGIQKGVTLSAAQIAEVNTAAGANVATIIQQNGYYLQILDPGAQVRGNRGTPIINLWYTDGGSVQQITLASIDIQ